jgi:hypothetical protein
VQDIFGGIMTFSKEDRAAWDNSEIMQEFEKFADDVLNPPLESYQPISIEGHKTWEEEDWSDEQKLVDAADELLSADDSFEEEMCVAQNKRLLYRLEKLAEQLADKSNIKAAYRVERTVQELKALLREENNEKH